MESRPDPASLPALDPAPEHVVRLAEDLPELYRLILDRVAELERTGARADAGRIRASATAAYSSAWDEAARRLLSGLLSRADRQLARPGRPRGWTLQRRPPTAR